MILPTFIDDTYKMNSSIKLKLPIKLADIQIPFQGYVSLKLRDAGGNIIHEENHNEIVYLGRHRVARVIFEDPGVVGTELGVNTLKVAGGAAVPPADPFSPAPPAVTDAGLFELDPAKIKTFSFDTPVFNDVSTSSAPIVTLTKTILCTEVNLLVNELGAFFGSSGPMFAHYTCSTLDLRENAGTGLEVTWQFVL